MGLRQNVGVNAMENTVENCVLCAYVCVCTIA